MKTLLLLLALALALPAFAQQNSWEVGAMPVPTSSTNPCSDAGGSAPRCGRTLHVSRLVVVNTTATAATVTLTDASTNCAGAACTVFSASIAANTTYTVDLGGVRATGGVLWSASAAGVTGWIGGN